MANTSTFPIFIVTLWIVTSMSCNQTVDKTSGTSTDFKKHEHKVGYIDPSKAILNEGFHVCNESKIYQYYNPEKATYSQGKNGLRRFILENYANKGYTDSGYLTIRFVINCKGKAGRYIIHENDLDMVPKAFNPNLVEQLFDLTTKLEKWNPIFVHGAYRDSYMFLTYRIENGEIIEILP